MAKLPETKPTTLEVCRELLGDQEQVELGVATVYGRPSKSDPRDMHFVLVFTDAPVVICTKTCEGFRYRDKCSHSDPYRLTGKTDR